MVLPPDIIALVERLNQELDQIEQNVEKGLGLVRIPLSRFPENTILVQFFVYLSNVEFFIDNYRRRIQKTLEMISGIDLSDHEMNEVGEELAAMLGVVFEIKVRVERIIGRLSDLS